MNRATIRVRTGLGLSVLMLLLSACSSDGKFPSLARRPAERISGTAQPVTPEAQPSPAQTTPAPELTARLAQLVEQAREADRRFAAHRARAEQLSASAAGAAVASESWSVAMVALADLESARSDAMIALSTLDGMHATERVEHYQSDTADAAAIAAARDQVMGMVADEDRVLATLRGRLRS